MYNLNVNRTYVHSHTQMDKMSKFIGAYVCVPIQDGPPYVASGDVTVLTNSRVNASLTSDVF